MSVKETTQAGNSVIHTKSLGVENIFDEEVKSVIVDLIDTMKETGLVGMAAPQIGKNKRIFVTEIRHTKFREGEEDELRVFINPEIIESSEEMIESYEGCGSVSNSNFFGPVTRPSEVLVRALDREGVEFDLKAEGLLARVIQHEIDHLDGVLFVEKVEDMKKIMSKNEYLKYKEE
jgi:peptide deformylase